MFTRCIKNKTIINPRVFSNALPFSSSFYSRYYYILSFTHCQTIPPCHHPMISRFFFFFFLVALIFVIIIIIIVFSVSQQNETEKKKREEKLVPFSLMSLFPCSIFDWVDKECNFALPLRGCRKKGKQSRAFPSFLFQVSSPVKFRNNCVCCSFS